LSPAKLDEIKIKSNILAQFAAQKAKETEEDISEKVEEVAHKAKEEL
jgi:protein disulfide-isomerase A6